MRPFSSLVAHSVPDFSASKDGSVMGTTSKAESSASPVTTPEFDATVETRDPRRQLRQDALHHVAEDATGVDATNQDDRLRRPAVRLPILHHLRFELEVRRETRSEEHTSELQSRENLVCRL